MSDKRCKLAVVGAGYMAREHIRAFVDILDVEVCGIHSRTRARAEALAAEFSIPHVCDTASQLFERTQANLVVIAVPELSVNAACRECFNFPWTCLIEKPAGYNVKDAEEIAGFAGKANRTVFVALNRRHYSSTKTVLKDLDRLTGPRLIHVQDQEDTVAALRAGQPRLVVENWMYANSIHVIDYFSILGRGDIVSVEPIIRWSPQEPKFVAAKIAFDSGDIGLYEAVWNGPGPWAVSVTTQEKRWELKPLEQASFQAYGSRKLEPVSAHEWDSRFKPGLRAQAQLAAQAAMGQPTTLPSLEDALVSMRLVQAIYGDGLTRV